jgi:ribosome-binding factor A
MLGSTIRSEIAEIIARDLADPRLIGLPSITRVKVSSDLSVADVYITVMGTPGQQSAALNALRHSAGMMRTRITKALSLRVAPMLKFHLDEQLKKELETLAILNKVAEENRQLDLQRAAAAGDSAATADTEEDTTGDESKAE